MTKYDYMTEHRSKLLPVFQRKWDRIKGVTLLDRLAFWWIERVKGKT